MPQDQGQPQEQLLPFGGQPTPPPKGHDSALDKVEEWWRKQKRAAVLVGGAIRQTFDQVLDAERTGRYDLSVLNSTERSYLAVRLRIILRDEFNLPRGPGTAPLSLGVEGEGVEVALEQGDGWFIPSSAIGELAILVTAS